MQSKNCLKFCKKIFTEYTDLTMVVERFVYFWSIIVKLYGGINSDNVSMSSRFNVQIINVVYCRVALLW